MSPMEFELLMILLSFLWHQTLSYHGSWHDYPYSEYHDHDYHYSDGRNKFVFPDSSEEEYPQLTDVQTCFSCCPVSSQYKPVCGTDDVTYQNVDRLRCAIRCGVDVQLKNWSVCSQSRHIESPTNTKNKLQACMKDCPTTPEYNPVCGTDNVTYKNIGKLYCAQHCGVDVQLKRQMPCPSTTTATPIDAPNESLERIQNCISNCPVTSEYNPVCGSNDVTYSNIGRLECAKECGVDVSLRGRTACFLLTSTLPPTTTPSPTIGDIPFSSMTTKSTRFTIPQDILNSIFTTAAQPGNDDDDDEPKIDPRFNTE